MVFETRTKEDEWSGRLMRHLRHGRNIIFNENGYVLPTPDIGYALDSLVGLTIYQEPWIRKHGYPSTMETMESAPQISSYICLSFCFIPMDQQSAQCRVREERTTYQKKSCRPITQCAPGRQGLRLPSTVTERRHVLLRRFHYGMRPNRSSVT